MKVSAFLLFIFLTHKDILLFFLTLPLTIKNLKMDRATLDKINNDRQLVDLRMQAEDLINAMETMDAELFRTESLRVKKALDDRFAELIEQYE